MASLGFLSALTSPFALREGPFAPAARDLRAHRLPRVSCQKNHSGGDERSRLLLDRRDVLVGLGGLYGAAGQMALASPVMPPDIRKSSSCQMATDKKIQEQDPDSDLLKCCPPYQGTNVKMVDYTFPKTPIRVRRPAHLVIDDPEYMKKYTTAIQKMKALPPDDPCNFYQQAKIHCAYCNEAYDQVGFDVPLQVHFSWLFLPWHRYYLHFYERILGKLINDDTFALPFWNFDTPKGMTLPAIFTNPSSTLYNKDRDTSHYPPAIIDYKYSLKNTAGSGATRNELINTNLDYLRKVLFSDDSKADPDEFMGDPVRAGEEVTMGTGAMGQLESLHNAFHQWVGPPVAPYTDMGSFATSGRDCVFYCLHANVDRLWQIYRNQRRGSVEFTDRDWLDSTFIFYDENRQIVKVKVRDSLDPTKLCYAFEEVPIPWLGKVPRKKTAEPKTKVPVSEFGPKPRALTDTIRVAVPRPTTKGGKAGKREVLLIKDIQACSGPARFDVYITKSYGAGLAGPDLGEFIGSFVKLLHTHKGKELDLKGLLKLGITAVLEDIDAGSADNVVVSLVPRHGDITIGGLQIKLVQPARSA